MNDDRPADPRVLRALLAEIEVIHQRDREQDALCWAVLVTDEEFHSHVHVVAPFPTAEAALIHGGTRHAEDVRMNPEEAATGKPLWSYTVLPVFSPQSELRVGASKALVGPLPRDPGTAYCECGEPLVWSTSLFAYRHHHCDRTFRWGWR